MLKGRLGIDSAKVPHKDRAGLLYLARGALTTREGTLAFQQGETTEADALAPGDHAIPLQGVSMVLLGPGSTVSHDALRLLAHARTALAAIGEDGVRLYTAPPLIPDHSGLGRTQARAWADEDQRLTVARRMYAWRLDEVLPHSSLNELRGIEGARMRQSYRLLARQIGVEWRGRRYDRARPHAADLPNQALNHASSAVEAAAAIAVAATATIPQLGFNPRGSRAVLRSGHRRSVPRRRGNPLRFPIRQEGCSTTRREHRARHSPPDGTDFGWRAGHSLHDRPDQVPIRWGVRRGVSGRCR